MSQQASEGACWQPPMLTAVNAMTCSYLTQRCGSEGALMFLCRPGRSPPQPAPADSARAHQPGCGDRCWRRSWDADQHAAGVGQQQREDAGRSHVQRAADLLWVSRAGYSDRSGGRKGWVACACTILCGARGAPRCASGSSCPFSHHRRTGTTRWGCWLMCLMPVPPRLACIAKLPLS